MDIVLKIKDPDNILNNDPTHEIYVDDKIWSRDYSFSVYSIAQLLSCLIDGKVILENELENTRDVFTPGLWIIEEEDGRTTEIKSTIPVFWRKGKGS